MTEYDPALMEPLVAEAGEPVPEIIARLYALKEQHPDSPAVQHCANLVSQATHGIRLAAIAKRDLLTCAIAAIEALAALDAIEAGPQKATPLPQSPTAPGTGDRR